jgi:hypothetical protein
VPNASAATFHFSIFVAIHEGVSDAVMRSADTLPICFRIVMALPYRIETRRFGNAHGRIATVVYARSCAGEY